MDIKDRIILSELSLDARQSVKNLSKKSRLSESSVVYRLDRLVKHKILLNTHVIINPYALGKNGFRIYLSLQHVTDNLEQEIIIWLSEYSLTLVLAKEKQASKYLLMSWCEKIYDFYSFIEEFKYKYGNYIQKLIIHSYVAGHYFSRRYLQNSKGVEYIARQNVPIVKVDNLDLQILTLLSEDGRLSALTISQKLGKDSQTIILRMRHLKKKGVILGYGINLNISKIGYFYYKLNICFSQKVSKNTLLEFARNCINTVYVDETISEYDFELNVEVESEARLEEILTELRNLGSGFTLLEIKQFQEYFKLQFM
ncbi:MAG: Lrp/AsnC family transcriptional regulator [Candidatus Woesearchaeota archaeon]